jgi:hypothetical protein
MVYPYLLSKQDADGTGVSVLKKQIVGLVGGFGIQANNLWYALRNVDC